MLWTGLCGHSSLWFHVVLSAWVQLCLYSFPVTSHQPRTALNQAGLALLLFWLSSSLNLSKQSGWMVERHHGPWQSKSLLLLIQNTCLLFQWLYKTSYMCIISFVFRTFSYFVSAHWFLGFTSVFLFLLFSLVRGSCREHSYQEKRKTSVLHNPHMFVQYTKTHVLNYRNIKERLSAVMF